MGIISWIVLGLIVGIIAKWLVPGKDLGGLPTTAMVGIAGALVGGFLSSLVGLGSVTGLNFSSILIALGGALLLLFGYHYYLSGNR